MTEALTGETVAVQRRVSMRKARRWSAMAVAATAVAAMAVAAMLNAWPAQAAGAASPAGLSAASKPAPEFVPGELLVRFRPAKVIAEADVAGA